MRCRICLIVLTAVFSFACGDSPTAPAAPAAAAQTVTPQPKAADDTCFVKISEIGIVDRTKVLSGQLTITNNSLTCTADWGMASYNMPESKLESQTLFEDSGGLKIAPGGTGTIKVNVPTTGCFQIDPYVNLKKAKLPPYYNVNELLIPALIGGTGWCSPPPPPPAPTPPPAPPVTPPVTVPPAVTPPPVVTPPVPPVVVPPVVVTPPPVPPAEPPTPPPPVVVPPVVVPPPMPPVEPPNPPPPPTPPPPPNPVPPPPMPPPEPPKEHPYPPPPDKGGDKCPPDDDHGHSKKHGGGYESGKPDDGHDQDDHGGHDHDKECPPDKDKKGK